MTVGFFFVYVSEISVGGLVRCEDPASVATFVRSTLSLLSIVEINF